MPQEPLKPAGPLLKAAATDTKRCKRRSTDQRAKVASQVIDWEAEMMNWERLTKTESPNGVTAGWQLTVDWQRVRDEVHTSAIHQHQAA